MKNFFGDLNGIYFLVYLIYLEINEIVCSFLIIDKNEK